AIGVQLGVLHRLVGSGAAAEMESSSAYGLQAGLPAIAKSIGTGLVLGGVFTPVDPNSGNFWFSRLGNAGVMGLTFGSLTAGAIGLRATGNAILANDIVANGLSGIPAGVISADGQSLVSTGHVASWRDRGESMANFAVGGAIAGGVNMLHEYVAPTSGIRGVRSVKDMTELA